MEIRNLSDEEKLLLARFRLCDEADKEEILRQLKSAMDEAQQDYADFGECE